MNCSLQASLSLGILQARILKWVAMSSSREIFPTQALNPDLPHCRQILYSLSHQEHGMSQRKVVLFFFFFSDSRKLDGPVSLRRAVAPASFSLPTSKRREQTVGKVRCISHLRLFKILGNLPAISMWVSLLSTLCILHYLSVCVLPSHLKFWLQTSSCNYTQPLLAFSSMIEIPRVLSLTPHIPYLLSLFIWEFNCWPCFCPGGFITPTNSSISIPQTFCRAFLLAIFFNIYLKKNTGNLKLKSKRD